MHQTPLYISHLLVPPLHCGPLVATSIATEETHADLSRNVQPRVVFHNYSGTGCFFHLSPWLNVFFSSYAPQKQRQ